MDKTQFGAYHLGDQPELYEVQRDNNFQFIVTGVDNILRAGASEGDTDPASIFTKTQETLQYSVVSTSIPNFSQEPLTVNRGNSVIKAAGRPTFSDGTLVVNDYIGADTKSALMAWQRLSYDVKTDTIGKMSDYKKTCYLMEFDPSFNLIRTWKLIGCWVSAITESEFTMANAGEKTISATITFDRAIPEV